MPKPASSRWQRSVRRISWASRIRRASREKISLMRMAKEHATVVILVNSLGKTIRNQHQKNIMHKNYRQSCACSSHSGEGHCYRELNTKDQLMKEWDKRILKIQHLEPWYTWFQVWFHNILHIHEFIYEFIGHEMSHMNSWSWNLIWIHNMNSNMNS